MKINNLILVLILFLTSCSGKLILLKNKKDDEVYKKMKKSKSVIHYPRSSDTTVYYPRLKVGDEIQVTYLNQPIGEEGILISNKYQVNTDGDIIMPYIGRLNFVGKKTEEIRKELEVKYAAQFIKPEIDVKIISHKVFLFGEFAKTGSVLLTKERMHLIEVISMAGGVKDYANTHKIKIIRGLDKQEIIWVDLTNRDILRSDDLIVQDEDIIYAEPIKAVLFSKTISPYITVFSSIASLATIIILISTRIK